MKRKVLFPSPLDLVDCSKKKGNSMQDTLLEGKGMPLEKKAKLNVDGDITQENSRISLQNDDLTYLISAITNGQADRSQ